MINIYEAGAMSYYYNQSKPELAEQWREQVNYLLRGQFRLFNPTENFKINHTYDARGVVYQNMHYLNNCDIMLINLNDLEQSPGSLFELFFAFINHKPVIAFGDTKIYNQPHIHESITMKFDSLIEATNYIQNMYGQL